MGADRVDAMMSWVGERVGHDRASSLIAGLAAMAVVLSVVWLCWRLGRPMQMTYQPDAPSCDGRHEC